MNGGAPPDGALAGARPAADAALERLCAFYETLSPQSLAQLGALYAPQAWFKDPFNEVVGVPAIERIFRHMFDQVEAPRFVVTTRLRDGDQAMLGWEFGFGPAARRITVRGVSHLLLDAQGRVLRHRDYWDAAEELYARLPLIGVLMRWLRRRLSAS
jgi:steroid Delta-isomerase